MILIMKKPKPFPVWASFFLGIVLLQTSLESLAQQVLALACPSMKCMNRDML